jgi:uncharacterized protein YigE (DUF2233 family)
MKKYFSIVALLSLTILMGGGCFQSSEPLPQERAVNIISEAKKTVKEQEATPFTWKHVAYGIDRAEQISMQDGWQARIVVYRFDPKQVEFRLLNSSSTKTIRAWRDEVPDALFMMNGVYFKTDTTPAGSLRINGKEYGKTKFDADKSGLIVFDHGPSIMDTTNHADLISSASSSAQSYPFLVKDGAASVSEDSHQLGRRSFIGTDTDGDVYLGAYPDGEISLYEFSKLVAELPIKWKYALNLDGGPSTSYISKIKGAEEIEDGYVAVPNVIVVMPKK